MLAPLRADMFDPACPSTLTPFRIADKWGGMIVQCLADGPRRYSELRVPMHRTSPKVLTESLRALERDGMILRTAYPGIPKHVEYELTALGRTLLQPIAACREWAAEHLDQVREAREAYEAAVRPAGQPGQPKRGAWSRGPHTPPSRSS